MVEYYWPARDKSQVIGRSYDRLDGLAKSTGAAKYTYDVNLENQLIAHAKGCPHAHCRIKAIDTTAAKGTAGVVHVETLKNPGDEIQWQGELLAVVAAESEAAAAEGVSKLKIEYEVLESFTDAENLENATEAGRTRSGRSRVVTEREPGDDLDDDEEKQFVEQELARLFGECEHVVEGYYGIDAITHCCLEPHGSTVMWEGDKLIAYLSTQNVSRTDDGFASSLDGVSADDVEVRCQYIGGGFGSKFAPDYWGVAAANISKATGRPVKFLLSREQELQIAGNRPSGYIKVKIGADKDGKIQVWDSHHWGTSGPTGGGVSQSVVPYVITPKNYRGQSTSIQSNTAPSRAWRAPNHPQACALSQTAVDDLAAKMGADSYDVFMDNLDLCSNGKGDVYREEMKIGAGLIDWKANWHAHGKGPASGSVVDGLGMALHTWGGVANNSTARVKVYPDGSVETFCGSQDLGTGTRTVIAQVVAESFGLNVGDISVNIGSSNYPDSGASGGSTTVGGVSESHRRASLDAVAKIFELAAKELGVDADDLEALDGAIRVQGGGNSITWKKACSLLGMKPLEVTASHRRGDPSPLSNSGVGGVQMAHVEVDRETGVVRMKKFVAVQDQGLVINPKTCISQIQGGVIMGIAAALFEHRVTDEQGAFVNADSFEKYRLARLGDVGDVVVHLYEPESERTRGVIGNGEPPAISPKAAISNAVCNALGVRVPTVPLTPNRVLEALEKAGRRA